MGKEWFYLRASDYDRGKKCEQSFERQKGILEKNGYILSADNTFIDITSGKTKKDDREQFEKMLSILSEDDWVICSETSRFAQSYINGMELLDILILDKKVNVRFVSNGIDIRADETMNPYTWYTISQIFLADELQRRLIGYDTANVLDIKRKKGITLGRPRIITDDMQNTIISMHEQGERGYIIASKLGISAAAVSNCVKAYKNSKK